MSREALEAGLDLQRLTGLDIGAVRAVRTPTRETKL